MNDAWRAVLGTDGVLSHLSAAWLWNLELPSRGSPESSSIVHVTIAPQRRVHPMPGVRIHRRRLSEDHVIHLRDVPVTKRLRTAIDFLEILPRQAAATALDRWLQIKVLSFDELADQLRAHSGRHGSARLRDLLQLCAAGEALSERLLHGILRDAGLDGWRPNAAIGSYRADIAFEQERLIVEVDGMAHHISPDRFQHDRIRQNALVNSGWTVLRFTWADLTLRPGYVVRTVRAALKLEER